MVRDPLLKVFVVSNQAVSPVKNRMAGGIG